MNVQLVVAAMHQKDDSLISKMNIQTDAVIGNQCDECSNIEYSSNGHRVLYCNRQSRGVGTNRNTALSHSEGDILTFADEDMTFVDGYEAIIKEAFEKLPDADAIIFNTVMCPEKRNRRLAKRIKRVRFYNALSYGASRISVKATALKRENITFHTCFGGGTRYSCGEDTIFIADLLKHKLKIYTYPSVIASVDSSSSTWFSGYTDKYLHDKGALYAAISKRFAKLLCFQDLIRHKHMYENKSFFSAYRTMKTGIRNYKELKNFKE